jgi:hypothetical protein
MIAGSPEHLFYFSIAFGLICLGAVLLGLFLGWWASRGQS